MSDSPIYDVSKAPRPVLARQVLSLKLAGFRLVDIAKGLRLTKGTVAGIVWRDIRLRGTLPPIPRKVWIPPAAVVAPMPMAAHEEAVYCCWQSGWPPKFECRNVVVGDGPYCLRHTRVLESRQNPSLESVRR